MNTMIFFITDSLFTNLWFSLKVKAKVSFNSILILREICRGTNCSNKYF